MKLFFISSSLAEISVWTLACHYSSKFQLSQPAKSNNVHHLYKISLPPDIRKSYLSRMIFISSSISFLIKIYIYIYRMALQSIIYQIFIPQKFMVFCSPFRNAAHFVSTWPHNHSMLSPSSEPFSPFQSHSNRYARTGT